jgi:hypothetical protein
MVRRSIAVLCLCLGTMFALSGLALADTGEIIEPQNEPPTAKNGFQAITCSTDEPVPAEATKKCSPETPDAFFTQAAGHPPVGFTQYIVKHEETTGKVEPLGVSIPTSPITEPEKNRSIRTLRVDLPPGLTVNPNATPKCKLEDFKTIVGGQPSCAPESIVGREEITLVTTVGGVVPAPEGIFGPGQTLPKGAVVAPSEALGTKIPVYNIEPKAGEPALFGFVAAGKEEVFLETEVSWQNDFHESFTIKLPEPEPPFATLVSRLVNFGQEAGNVGLVKSGNGTYINNPTTCYSATEYPSLYSTWFRAESYGVPSSTFPNGSTPFEAKVEDSSGNLIQQTGCDNVPFTPGLDVAAGTDAVDSPAPASVTTTLKYLTGGESAVQESHLKSARVTLPEGMGLNPSGSVGLVACTDAQFGKGQRSYDNSCPADSVIGTTEITSPPLERPLKGLIYVGEQKSQNPASGEEFRILVEAKEPNEGIDVRLVGQTVANPTTGQLTAVFNEQQVGELAGKLPEGLPQVPFDAVKLSFDGPHRVLTSPPICGEAQTNGQFEPWARPGTNVPVSAKFKLTSEPAGGTCPTTLAARRFTPTYTAATDGQAAGQYSPFHVRIARTDGQQELKVVNVTLPKGLTGKLAGIPYCSEPALNAATGLPGKTELATPSCPSASELGTSRTVAGTGATPVALTGHVYLAGPYRGAPLSLAIITPAVSGPFDLGTVVVRVALNVDPVTAQINAVSDVIPDVFGGVKLDIRNIDVDISRNEFMLNPTNCSAQATTGTISGGGADPTNPAAFSSYAVTAPFQATGCNKLNFKPKFNVRLKGPTTRAKNPQLRAILSAGKGEANVARTALTLPHSLFLDQSHIRTVCTRVQLAAGQCPKASVYGHAEAKSPLLENKLTGPVYLVSSNNKLPNLLADLHGQVNVQLRGVISSKRGGLKTVFPTVPDVPVSKFILNMQGGKKSLLVNSTNTCKGAQLAVLNIKGQNGKKAVNNKFKLNVASCGGKSKGKKKGK